MNDQFSKKNDANETQVVKVDSDEAAWALIRQMAANSAFAESVQVEFQNYPILSFKFDGPQFDQSLPTRVMDALIAVQHEVYRLYALAVYEDESYSLSQDERDRLEVFFRVEPGSSWITGRIDKALEAFGTAAGKNVKGTHLVVITVVGALALGSPIVLGKMQEEQTARSKIESEERVRMAEVLHREELLKIAMDNPIASRALEIADQATKALAQSVKRGETVQMRDGTVVSESVAKEIYPRKPRRKSLAIQMNDNYLVKSFQIDGAGTVEIESSDGQVYTAAFDVDNTSLREALFKAYGTRIFLAINAKDFEGQKKELIVVATPSDLTTAWGSK